MRLKHGRRGVEWTRSRYRTFSRSPVRALSRRHMAFCKARGHLASSKQYGLSLPYAVGTYGGGMLQGYEGENFYAAHALAERSVLSC